MRRGQCHRPGLRQSAVLRPAGGQPRARGLPRAMDQPRARGLLRARGLPRARDLPPAGGWLPERVQPPEAAPPSAMSRRRRYSRSPEHHSRLARWRWSQASPHRTKEETPRTIGLSAAVALPHRDLAGPGMRPRQGRARSPRSRPSRGRQSTLNSTSDCAPDRSSKNQTRLHGACANLHTSRQRIGARLAAVAVARRDACAGLHVCLTGRAVARA